MTPNNAVPPADSAFAFQVAQICKQMSLTPEMVTLDKIKELSNYEPCQKAGLTAQVVAGYDATQWEGSLLPLIRQYVVS
jgi:hypothetical protein